MKDIVKTKIASRIRQMFFFLFEGEVISKEMTEINVLAFA